METKIFPLPSQGRMHSSQPSLTMERVGKREEEPYYGLSKAKGFLLKEKRGTLYTYKTLKQVESNEIVLVHEPHGLLILLILSWKQSSTTLGGTQIWKCHTKELICIQERMPASWAPLWPKSVQDSKNCSGPTKKPVDQPTEWQVIPKTLTPHCLNWV